MTKINLTKINFVVEEDPLPQSRPRFSFGRVYEKAEVKAFKRIVGYRATATMNGHEPLEGMLICRLKFFRKFAPTSRRFGDFDNLAKSVCDAMNGIVFKDDSQIVSCTIEKFTDAGFPRAEIQIEKVGNDF